jgi:hypothetical protein
MENNLKNLPPFYIGQKVVCINANNNFDLIKGEKYTVTNVVKTKCCDKWQIEVGIIFNKFERKCVACNKKSGTYNTFLSDRFAPLHSAPAYLTFKELKQNEFERINEPHILIMN